MGYGERGYGLGGYGIGITETTGGQRKAKQRFFGDLVVYFPVQYQFSENIFSQTTVHNKMSETVPVGAAAVYNSGAEHKTVVPTAYHDGGVLGVSGSVEYKFDELKSASATTRNPVLKYVLMEI